jgi:hypothetical protein
MANVTRALLREALLVAVFIGGAAIAADDELLSAVIVSRHGVRSLPPCGGGMGSSCARQRPRGFMDTRAGKRDPATSGVIVTRVFGVTLFKPFRAA